MIDKVVFIIGGVFLCATLTTCKTPDNLTIINNLRNFKPLLFGDDFDYYISEKPATVEDAEKVCESIGKNFHLLGLQNETEYRRLLPYLRSLEIPKVWTNGVKYQNADSNSQYVWTYPSPSSPITFLNFPTANMLSKLTRLEKLGKKDLPRCRNGLLSLRCEPVHCDVNMAPCQTTSPPCTIIDDPPCSITRNDCGASCNNCTIIDPVCTVVQEPCKVITPPCKVIEKPCTITPPICHTYRPECQTHYPPCEVTTPKPCTTTPSPCSTTQHACTTTQPPCIADGKCAPPVTFCKPIFKCEPEICQPGVIICPTPITICPPEVTTCSPPVVNCPKPVIDCPDPIVDCPDPKAVCKPEKPQIICDAPEVNCPEVVLHCPGPSYNCPSPIVDCPAPEIICDEPGSCNYPPTPPPCPSNNPDEYIDEDYDTEEPEVELVDPAECDDCLPNGCIALRKQTDFKYKLQNCSDKLHFICEGR